MPKVEEVYKKAVSDGKAYQVFSNDIRTLLAHDLKLAYSADIYLHFQDEIPADSPFFKNFERICKGEPIEYVLRECKFLNHKLYVDERVLIPRSETEELVALISERIYDYFDPRNYLVVADIGTGSGCIAIALKTIAHNWLITASDTSPDALEVAKKNISDGGFNIQTLEGPSLEPYIKANMNLDIIVSNPPYILNKEEAQDSVKNYEPASALWLEEGNNVYEDIFKNYKKVKKGSLLMCFEIGYDLEDDLKGLMEKYLENYTFEFIKDLNGLTRFLFVYCE